MDAQKARARGRFQEVVVEALIYSPLLEALKEKESNIVSGYMSL